MSQAARAHDPWADDLHTPPRRRSRTVDSWASAEELEVLGGLGRDPSATWTVLTLDRDDDDAAGDADAGRSADRVVSGERELSPSWDAGVDRSGSGEPGLSSSWDAGADRSGSGEPGLSPFWDAGADDEAVVPRPARRFRRSSAARTPVAGDRAPALRLVDHEAAPIDYVSEPPAPLLPGQRRTVVIRGRVPAPAAVAAPDRRRPAARTRDRVGHRPDRVALWAFVLGLMLILVAVLSAGGSG